MACGQYVTFACDREQFLLAVGMVVGLILSAGLMAGLTMGLLSLDKLTLQIWQLSGSPTQQRQAGALLPLLQKHHFLLVALLLVNAAANEALPIFLSKLVSESTSVLLSVTCVLVFGEILPSALFTGSRQLQVAYFCTPIVKFLLFITSPISYPISKLLDCALGDDHDITRYKRKELKALITLQRENLNVKKNFLHHLAHSPSKNKPSPNSYHQMSMQDTNLNVDEVTVIHGALELASKNAKEIMVPMEDVFMLSNDQNLTAEVMADILASGFSRIPVYEGNRSNILGLLLIKRLIILDPEDERPISDLHLRKPIVVDPNFSCYNILNEFQKGRSHIALLTKQADIVKECWKSGEDIGKHNVVFEGIVTIEDVLEELIQEEIEDESDLIVQDIVQYWDTKAKKKRLKEAGVRSATKKLRQLATKARRRVKSRRSKVEKNDEGEGLSDIVEVQIEDNENNERQPLL